MRSNESMNARYMRVGALALGATLVLGACAGRDNANTDSAMGTAMTPATGMSDTGAMTGGMSANATMANMSDANIMAVISMVNSNEIGAGKMAQEKGTSGDVKSFARDMVTQHTAMQGEADKLATQLNITPEAPAAVGDQMKRDAMMMSDSLKATAKGNAFDMQYINGQVKDHQMVLNNLTQFQTSAQNAQLRDMITKTIPKIQQHLDRARQLQTAMGTRA